MNPFNASYLFDSQRLLSNLLIRYMGGSTEIFERDQELKYKLINLENELFKDKNPRRYQIFLENKFDEMIVYIMNMARQKQNFELLDSVLSLLVIITNNSEDFVVSLMQTNLSELLINDTIMFSTIGYRYLIPGRLSSYIIIIFNIIRHKKCREYFHRNEKISKFKEVILPLLNTYSQNIRITTLMVFGFLNKGEKDIKVILENVKIIEDAQEFLANALESEDRRIDELLQGLLALAEIGPIKIKIVNTDGLIDTLKKIVLSNDFESKDVNLALDILRELCIDGKVGRLKIDDVDKVLATSTDCSIKRNAEKLKNVFLQSLDNATGLTNDEYDIFISYDELDIDIVDEVATELSKEWKVYINPRSNDFQTKIDCSHIVILGVSLSYQMNERCKSEAFYAKVKGKEIIALILKDKLSLGITLSQLIRSNKSLKLWNDSTFIESMKLLREIIRKRFQDRYPIEKSSKPTVLEKSKLEEYQQKTALSSIAAKKLDKDNSAIVNKPRKLEALESPKIGESSQYGHSSIKTNNIESIKPKLLDPPDYTTQDIEQWDKNQVSNWLNSSKLSGIHNKLVDFDGELLRSIIRMKKATPEVYYKHVSEDLKLSFVEQLRFDSALEKLG